ncbi:unnamed protein product, partial [marine sediment metagenome]
MDEAKTQIDKKDFPKADEAMQEAETNYKEADKLLEEDEVLLKKHLLYDELDTLI